MEANEIRATVEGILAHASVTFSAAYVGERRNAMEGKTTMDEWSCTLTKRYADGDMISESFDYFTGLGLRKLPAGRGRPLSWEDVQSPRELQAWKQKTAKPVPPHAADVLHCLILDSSAAGQTFADWCDDFGYDTDSRRALNTYEACQNSAVKLRRVLNANNISALETALQGY